jgi:hypothetical protein
MINDFKLVEQRPWNSTRSTTLKNPGASLGEVSGMRHERLVASRATVFDLLHAVKFAGSGVHP